MPLTEEQRIYAAIDVYVSIADFEFWFSFTYYVTQKMSFPVRGYVGFQFFFSLFAICNHGAYVIIIVVLPTIVSLNNFLF